MARLSSPIVLLTALAVYQALAQDLDLQETNAEGLAWQQVNGMDRTDLTSFLRDFPTGEHAEKARLYLSLQERIASIRDRNEEPEFVIFFGEFGERWQAWEARRPDQGSVGIFLKKTDTGATLGIFSPVGGPTTFSFDEYGIPVIPTGDGSLVAIRTNGLQFEWVDGLSIQTPGDNPLYFGVLGDVGLTYLHGQGTVYVSDEQFDLPGAQRQYSGRVSGDLTAGFWRILGMAAAVFLLGSAIYLYVKYKRGRHIDRGV